MCFCEALAREVLCWAVKDSAWRTEGEGSIKREPGKKVLDKGHGQDKSPTVGRSLNFGRTERSPRDLQLMQGPHDAGHSRPARVGLDSILHARGSQRKVQTVSNTIYVVNGSVWSPVGRTH